MLGHRVRILFSASSRSFCKPFLVTFSPSSMNAILFLMPLIALGLCVSEKCEEPIDEGDSPAVVIDMQPEILYGYDEVTNRCLGFWYNGRGGNSNKFKSREECESECVRSSLQFKKRFKKINKRI
ncbi:Kunitz/Bovine pancreatic trypsin inhibitor domain protein [Oesophagostomum dentatum]|uniref:Kunitz/Bovine pancreatic trypsin inhibitor domain protein n=1 Tax=Oesophagostomum dentatum TaxID=61180 RepID=A0A0B1TES8_OESDE|nr:Kunitz/Bovine pancreatic trypsin inhibitor domain protein [Oesophagostomum dentatum]